MWTHMPHSLSALSRPPKLKTKGTPFGYLCQNNSSLSEKRSLGPREKSQKQAFSPLRGTPPFFFFYFTSKSNEKGFVVRMENKV